MHSIHLADSPCHALQGFPHACMSHPGSLPAIRHQFRTRVSFKHHQQLLNLPHRSRPAVHSEASDTVTVSQAGPNPARTELAKAGISEEAIDHALEKCKTYSNWDLASELRPAIQMWVNAIGALELSHRLMRAPCMMLTTPACCNDVFVWLISLGIDADRIQEKQPKVMTRKLSDVQSTVTAIQQGLLLKDEQLPAFFRRHFPSLLQNPHQNPSCRPSTLLLTCSQNQWSRQTCKKLS